jgi:hypothetical protein
MRKYAAFALLILLVSCKADIGPGDLSRLNGYWEIEKAALPDGSEKTYSPAMLVDYLHIEGTSGYRQKVMPQLDGKFRSNGVRENITAEFREDKAFLVYHTGFARWKEELLEVSTDHFTARNGNGLTCYYKRYEPLNLN